MKCKVDPILCRLEYTVHNAVRIHGESCMQNIWHRFGIAACSRGTAFMCAALRVPLTDFVKLNTYPRFACILICSRARFFSTVYSDDKKL